MKQLQWIGARSMQEVASGPVPRRRQVRGRRWAIAAAAALTLAAGAVAALWSGPSPGLRPSFRFTIASLPVNAPRPSLSVSPDGRYVAFTAAASGGQPLLYVRPVDALEARPIAKTEGASLPFWSPDSRHIGFGAAGRLKRVDLATGHVQNVAALGGDVFTGGTWNADGVILFSAGAGSGIKRVSQGGGEPSDMTRVSATEGATFHGLPSFLPDGRRFLFTAFFAGPFSSRERPGAVWVGSLDSATSRPVLSNSSRAIFASGYLLFNRADALLAQRFDAERLTFDGDPFLVAHGLSVLAPLGVGMFDASRTGVLAYEAGDEQSTVSVPAQGRLSWYDRSGTRLRSIGPPGHYAGIELSPDGRRIALHQHDEAGGGDIWILDQRGSSTRLTFDPGHDLAPVWSPDGQRILFASDRDGSFNLYHTLASGAGADELVLDSPDVTFPGDWSPAPDPARVLFDRFDGGARNVDVWMLPVDGPPTPRPLMLIGDGFTERTARFSPDGRWITYVSDESGRDEVYVRSYSSAGKWQVSKDGGRYPRWTRGGREIVYLQRAAGIGQDNVFTVMAVPISDDGTALSSGSPRAMFTADFNTSDIGPSYPYDVSVDSQQILVNERVALPDSPQPLSTATITVIVNWQAGLR